MAAAEPSPAETRSGNIANYLSGANYLRTNLTITWGIPRLLAWLRKVT